MLPGAFAKALRDIGHDPVVVGGSAATVHAPEVYRSLDIDMVVIGGVHEPQALVAVMQGIGFRLDPGHYFVHSHSKYTVEFVPSPVAIAGDVIENFATVQTTHGGLRVLHVEDVIADRINKYVVYNDPDSFEVAAAVARQSNASMDRVGQFIERQAVGIMANAYKSAFQRLLRRLRGPVRK